jgi:hypothetical protein
MPIALPRLRPLTVRFPGGRRAAFSAGFTWTL